MTAKDFMIGDWVHSLQIDVDTQITDIETDGEDAVWLSDVKTFGRQFMNEIQPIPLTKDILEKNFHDPYEGVVWWPNDEPFYHIECLPLNGTRIIMPYTQYVHQLQHALRLCGINKEIKL